MTRSTSLALAAYAWWGLSALFWRELRSVDPIDQLAWRVSLGLLLLGGVWFQRRANPWRCLSRRHLGFGAVGALLLGSNWAAFLWAIGNDQTVEASLGYFLMPLVSVTLGVAFLGEKPRPLKLGAITLAIVGIVWILVIVGTVPKVAVILALSFGVYGLVRKAGPSESLQGLTLELTILTPIAMVFLATRSVGGVAVGGNAATTTLILIGATGLVTVVPLLLFAAAARTAPLSVIGLLSYLSPVVQFFIGWQVFGESVPSSRLIGFVWIWAALLLVIVDELRPRPQSRLATA